MDLEKELACSICTELLYHPLTLLDCLHTFCGACLKEWFDWQAAAARTSPDPPAPGTAIFTCPSCRAAVRDTRHNSTVQSLLDMILVAHPEKAKTQGEKDEMDARYKPGQKVLPEVKFARRTADQTRLEAQERLLIDEVREMSLREAVNGSGGSGAGGGGGSSSSRTRRRAEDSDSRSRTARRRAPRATSSTRDHSTRGPGGDHGQGQGPDRTPRRRELGSDARRRTDPATRLSREATDSPSALSRTSSSASRRTRDDSLERQRRQIEHQSSLRSLISSSDAADIDMEREVEEFARQIQEEGLLDGLDLDNIDLTNNDELSRRITEAYRRRQRDRERQRREARERERSRAVTRQSFGGMGGAPSSHSHERSASDSIRPTERQSRTPSTTSQSDERSRPPPSSRSSFLEVQEQQRRRRRNGSHSRDRSATVPVAPTQPELQIGSRSQTDLDTRAHSLASSTRRPILPEEARSISTSEVPSSSPRFIESPPTTSLPFSARINGLGLAQSKERTSTPPESNKRTSRPKPKSLVVQPPESQASSTAVRGMAGQVVSPLAGGSASSHKQRSSPLFEEPRISCNRCAKENIQYELHYNCADCHEGQWNICLKCYRLGKGCLHWFGFGYGGFSKWERLRVFQPSITEPHKLLASRFIAPATMIRSSDSNSANRKVWSSEDPYERLQSGTFCALCLAWTNDCYWRCEMCNQGDWGFCNDCVNQGRSCTHALLPLVHQQDAQQPTSPPASPHSSSHPSSATMMVGLNATSIGPFKVLTFITTCDVCRNPIAPTQSRFHCFDCVSSIVPNSRPGDYDICEGCYNNLVSDGAISRENGFAGWRRCLQGHRMVIVDFQEGKGGQRRYVVRDLVGGRRLRVEDVASDASLERWIWPQGDSECERLVAKDVGATATQEPASAQQPFPPDGGFGLKAVAGWAWYPAEGVEDELLFPKGAEIMEIDDANGEWYYGLYMGNRGLFPSNYVKPIDE
ncbi:hypothetical protein BD289DRAFT_504134 [Coniella lustricola]|uniref:RING-type domain-containing protein n=1 Tax=Coniella lustricola TaxID=2025994 RepID=A0A2T3AFB6_9PEZI|nr:hypothetical protein BD289DRAFT_504134 [Coniella lustricola]